MPPLPSVPNVVKVIISGTYHDAKWLNILHQSYTGSVPSAASLAAMIGVWKTQADICYAAEMSVDNEVTGFEMIDLSSDTGAIAELSDSTFGARSGDFNPASVALVISAEISRRYRGGHPRTYAPFGTAGTFATGSTINWDSSFLADVQTKWDDMISGVNGFSSGGTTYNEMVNVSYVSGGARRTSAVVDPITSYVARDRICSQRRRLGKVGG